jgi:hypothetical protein
VEGEVRKKSKGKSQKEKMEHLPVTIEWSNMAKKKMIRNYNGLLYVQLPGDVYVRRDCIEYIQDGKPGERKIRTVSGAQWTISLDDEDFKRIITELGFNER